jgi:hypothetical protein
MSIFSKVLSKLGLGGKSKQADEAKPASPNIQATPAERRESTRSTRAAPDMDMKKRKAVQPVKEVDVVSQLEQLAAKNPQDLNWKQSIVDLLKLLDLDSSYDARREMAVELGCPADKMDDSAAMNIWLHKTVLQKIAENGGNIPQELLD